MTIKYWFLQVKFIMQCAEISDAGCPLTLVTKDFPRVPDRGFLLKTLYAGICHSDIHINDDEFDMGSGKVYRLREDIGINFTLIDESVLFYL